MISNYLLTFNSEHEYYESSDTLIKYLDEKHPGWRQLVVKHEEFFEFFKTDVHVFKNNWLQKLANEIFDIVSDNSLIESVWRDVTLKDWYRYAAIRRLIPSSPDTYLPAYIAELISGGFTLNGWGSTMISELYDFPDSVKIVLESRRFKGNNYEFLVEKAPEYWQEYPQEIKSKILKERDYYIRKNGTHAMWQVMTTEEKLYLTTVIVANEYSKFHDIIAFANYLIDKDESKLVLFTNTFLHQLDEIRREETRHDEFRRDDVRRGHHHRRFNQSFDTPSCDLITRRYTPSEQMSRFLAIAQADSNDTAYRLLNQAVRNLSSSTDF